MSILLIVIAPLCFRAKALFNGSVPMLFEDGGKSQPSGGRLQGGDGRLQVSDGSLQQDGGKS